MCKSWTLYSTSSQNQWLTETVIALDNVSTIHIFERVYVWLNLHESGLSIWKNSKANPGKD